MKIVLLLVLLLISLPSCLTEDSVGPGKASTFIRYYNGGYDDQAQTFDETTDDGFIILASTQITNTNATIQRSKIKLINTDKFGNVLWQTVYPSFTNTTNTSYYKGKSIIVEKSGSGIVTGYTIAGDSIDRITGASYLFIMQTDANGNFTKGKSLVALPETQGQSIVKDGSGYLVLGSRSNVTLDMVLARFRNDLSLEWYREYGEGGSSFVTGLITDSQNNIFWGGTVRRNNEPLAMRLVKTTPQSIGTAFDLDFGLPEYNEETGGICFSDFGPYFAFVGTTDEKGSKDILFKKISINGTTVYISKIIGDETIPEEGNSICTTDDGGVLIIGTSGLDEARDYYLIKLNHLGDVEWSKIFGSRKPDKGVSVKQVNDGSYVILGSTTLGGLSSIMLMKTDSRGNIE